MQYEYAGYLKTLIPQPDVEAVHHVDAVVIDAEALAKWIVSDFESETEWKKIPAQVMRGENSIRLEGRFAGETRIDIIPSDEPSFWVPLRAPSGHGSVFPIDALRFPILEITYRCSSLNARPAALWTYPGGNYLKALRPSRQWTTVARRITHFDFPTQVNDLVLRLYTTTRTVESMEIRQIRFRAMTPAEETACREDAAVLAARGEPRRYPLLDTFMPVGVVMNAEMAKRHAEMLAIPLDDYWFLVVQDMILHHQNCIALEKSDRLSVEEFEVLLRHMAPAHIKLVAFLDLPPEGDDARLQSIIETRVKPFAEAESMLAWGLSGDAEERELRWLLRIQDAIAACDEQHPCIVTTLHPNGYSLFAPFFPASGIAQFKSHQPWEFSEMVSTHARLCKGQQFWMIAPTFVHATNTPEWSSPPELRLMINLAFAQGARGWFSYMYHNDPAWLSGSYLRSLTGPFLMFSDLWLELDKRMARFLALVSLLLEARPAPLPEPWFAHGDISEDYGQIPEGVPPTSSFRLEGKDFDLYFVIANDVRGMPRLNILMPPEMAAGKAVYDLTDFIKDREWVPMALERHIEMFPGQARFILVAAPEVCDRLCDEVAARLISDDRNQLSVNLRIARAYNLDIARIEALIDGAEHNGKLQTLADMDEASDAILDLLYSTPNLSGSRGNLIEASAAICGCDGALCRLMGRGKADAARAWGGRVVSLAREITSLRLQFHAGEGDKIGDQCRDVVDRSLKLLQEIRALY